MRRVVSFALALVVLVGAAAGAYVVGRSYAPAKASAAGPITAFYLDVGGSSSLGFQPTGITGHNGRRTSDGYANDVVLAGAYKGATLDLDQVGCPGETVQSILSTTTADHCYSLPETQLTQAEAYLRANQSNPGFVTVDLGFNNIRLCLSPAVVNEACVAAAIAAVKVDMPIIMKRLRAAAGPQVRFIGLLYSDPFLSHYFDGAAGPADATATLVAMDAMNAELSTVYTAAGAKVANVSALFDTDVTTRVDVANVGEIPENVADACAYTWDCYGRPFGPDDHPNDAGYALIAQAIEAVLPKSW